MDLEKLNTMKVLLKELRREDTEIFPAASLKEAIETIIECIEFIFESYQPERSKREDYKYRCLELNDNSSVNFIEIKITNSKEEAQEWVNKKPHLRTWHEFVDAVL